MLGLVRGHALLPFGSRQIVAGDLRGAWRLRKENCGYTDYEWFAKLTQRAVHFVTRLKENAHYGVVERRELPHRRGVRCDEVIFFFQLAQAGVECFFRRMEFYDEEQERALVFFRQRLADPDLDGADCHAADQVSTAPGYLRLVPVEFSGLVVPAIVRIPRLVGLVECPLPATAGTRLGTPATAVGAS